MKLRLLALIGTLLVAGLFFTTVSGSKKVDFMADIKPILNRKCMKCHGGVKQNGGFSLLTREEALTPTESGKVVIVPGNPDASEFMRRLTCTDPEERMPYRESPLSEPEINLFRQWIKEGAEWGVHWAYAPLKQPDLPRKKSLFGGLFSPENGAWGNNEIDQFILQRLEKEALTPTNAADKITLLRRVSLDLTGLPASEQLSAQFLADSTDGAYNRLVDSLLESSHFGERWASTWLDLARYADSKGYERDALRFVWRYRDWVIRAFNADMPYNQFLTEQIAGDLLPDPTDDQLLATAFHRNTPTNDEGGTDNEEFRTAAVLDRTNTTWEAVMGTTFACVQCHSHPYDPFFHDEYYKFTAFFNNSRDYDTQPDFPLIRWYAGEDSLKFLKLKAWLASNANPLEQERMMTLVRLWQPCQYTIECDSFENSALLDTKYAGYSHGGSSRLRKVALDGKTRLFFRSATATAGGSLTLHLDKKDGPVLTTIYPGPTKDGWAVYHTDFQPVSGTHDIFFVYENKALRNKPEEFGAQWDWFAFAPPFPGSGKQGYADAEKDFLHLMGAGCETTPVMWENPDDLHRNTHVFVRGNWMVHGDPVQPTTPKYMPAFPADQPANRLGLARWMTQPEHPLTSRVLVNRLWEQIFGIGIVETIEDFGTQGTPPSHPELLDWLAWTFSHDDQWSIKKTLRRMVLSATYRQSSSVTPALQERDPLNQLLARGPRVRLSAEQIRDQALAISGLLNEKMFGKPVMPFQPDGIWLTPWNGESWKLSKGNEQYRRAVYTYWKRSSPYPSMMTFDGAGRQNCTARRIRTNTPLQALVTLNDPVYMECARHFALKMQEKGGTALENQIEQGYRMATGRAISAAKSTILVQLYRDALADFQRNPQAVSDFLNDLACNQASPELAALAVVGNAIMNLDEVVVKG